jgi:hypothetical protein
MVQEGGREGAGRDSSETDSPNIGVRLSMWKSSRKGIGGEQRSLSTVYSLLPTDRRLSYVEREENPRVLISFSVFHSLLYQVGQSSPRQRTETDIFGELASSDVIRDLWEIAELLEPSPPWSIGWGRYYERWEHMEHRPWKLSHFDDWQTWSFQLWWKYVRDGYEDHSSEYPVYPSATDH